MDIRFQCNGPAQWKADVMVVLFCKGERLPDVAPCVDAAAPWLAIAPALRDARGDKDELTMLHGHPELNIPRVLAVGLGAREDVDVSAVRKALGSALRRCRAEDVDETVEELNKKKYWVTKLSTTGGFLKNKNVTLVIGTEDENVPGAIKILKECAGARQSVKYTMPSMSSGSMGPGANSMIPIDMQVGGCTVFVLDVDQYEKF